MIKTKIQSKWYQKWHSHSRRNHHHWGVFLLVALVTAGYLVYRVNDFSHSVELSIINVAQAAQVPPAGSPIALGAHPRVLFTGNELPVIRDRIAQYYQSEFQQFIDQLNNPNGLSVLQKEIAGYWGGMNYAFVAALDPEIMATKGFTFADNLNSSQEFCAVSASYTTSLLPSIAAVATNGHNDLSAGYPKNYYLSTVAAYDWCYGNYSDATKQAIVDAFVAAHNKRWAGVNYQTGGTDSQLIANNQDSARIQQTLGILAFYGDSYVSASDQQAMYDVFHAVWFDRVVRELNYFYPKTGWHEGSGDYSEAGFINLGIPLSFISSAVGSNYFVNTPYFSTFGEYVEANIKPHSLLAGSSKYMERWGTVSDGWGKVDCKPSVLISGMLRRGGSGNAGFVKWIAENRARSNCDTVFTQYGGLWSNGVIFGFVNGIRGITADYQSLPRTNKLGMEEYVFRSGYSALDSQIVFWARKFKMYGHDSPDYGEFNIHKYGNLILHAGNGKSGDGTITQSAGPLLRNIVGVHIGASDPKLGADTYDNSTTIDPYWGSLGYSKNPQIKGTTLAEDVGNGSYDHVSYDNKAWLQSVVNLSQREFVYLRGPENKEYVIVFDRMNTVNPSQDEKIWKVWVPVQPQFANGTSTAPRTGKWTSNNADVISVTNNMSSDLSGYANDFVTAPTHGKMYIKVQTPESKTINFLGGPGMEFQTGNDDGTIFATQTPLTQGNREYLGWGRIEIRPSVNQAFDNFQNVIQFGDSNNLAAMSETVKIVSADGKIEGSHIKDPSNHWNVMFVKSNTDLNTISSFTYTLDGSGTVKQLLTGMKKNTSYKIYDGSTLLGSYVSNSSGNIYFTSSLGSAHTYTVTDGGVLTNVPPSVSLTSPVAGLSIIAPGSITISATASDTEGTVSKVEFYQGTTLLNTDTVAPYTYVWANIPLGTYSVSAKAFDNSGASATSSAVSVIVGSTTDPNPPPPPPPPPPTGNQLPVANFDALTVPDGTIKGWAYDPDAPTAASTVHIYIDKKADKGGTLITGVTTNLVRNDVNTAKGITGAHGFEYVIPNEYRTGVNRDIFLYAIDNNNSTQSTLVAGSPKTFKLTSTTTPPPPPPPANVLPDGNFDEIRLADSVIRGWAYDPDNKTAVASVHIYINGPLGSGSLLTSNPTRVLRTDINLTKGITGNHGFEFVIPDAYKDNQSHSVYVYALDTTDSTKSSLITGSPKTFKITLSVMDTIQPTVSITSPVQGSVVSGAAVSITASALDNLAVAGVQFKLNGSNFGVEDTQSPYSLVWDSSQVANGAHTLTAVARDTSGNTQTATIITFTVNNSASVPVPTPTPTPNPQPSPTPSPTPTPENPNPQPTPTPTPSGNPPRDGSLVLHNGTVYFIEQGKKRPFTSLETFQGLGYKLTNVVTTDVSLVSEGEFIESSTVRHPRASLILNNGTVYFVGANLRYPFTSETVFLSWNNRFQDIVPANQADLSIPEGPVATINPESTIRHPRGTLIINNGTVYFMGESLRYPFPSAEVFLSWNNRFEDIVEATPSDMLVPEGGVVQMRL